MAEYFQSQINDNSVTFLVGMLENKVVGYALIKELNRKESVFIRKRKFAVLDQIAVEPTFQNKGVGSELIKKAVELTRKSGCTEIELGVWKFNDVAKRVFQKNGFSTYLEKMRIRFDM
jgi:ribosomal protein S18 acetylase RimI-like enzyme